MHILVQQNSSLPSRQVQKKLWEAVQLPGRHRCLAAIHAALASGAAANAADASGMTALHWAASGNPDAEAVTAAIAVLLAEKADIHFKTKNNQATPLHCATTNASPDAAIAAVLALTAAGADVRAKTSHNGEPLVSWAAVLSCVWRRGWHYALCASCQQQAAVCSTPLPIVPHTKFKLVAVPAALGCAANQRRGSSCGGADSDHSRRRCECKNK